MYAHEKAIIEQGRIRKQRHPSGWSVSTHHWMCPDRAGSHVQEYSRLFSVTGIGTIIGPRRRYITSSQCDSTRSAEKERALVCQENYKDNKRCASIAKKDGRVPSQMRLESHQKNWTFIAIDRDTCWGCRVQNIGISYPDEQGFSWFKKYQIWVLRQNK